MVSMCAQEKGGGGIKRKYRLQTHVFVVVCWLEFQKPEHTIEQVADVAC